ncbi:Peptidase, M23/M37 [Bacillus cereus 95/8201]|uniref:Peptidase M23 family protein n=5 Tax=Bacillus cereus group TaxID=86661 RepID=A0A0B5NL20_BACTU|nr:MULTISPECIES: SH3 domain-containing protein [Bacillus cereus group]ACK90961.1 peptidase, M23/M37 family [Bacillus cereus AH820]AJG78514.1 peptidase M23 family protein [Bacillus thuringiensis]AJH64271.1 peptidase M23 family protein [Bacillus cereus]AJH80902.1 peptidase M23 family protein [Bacillus thuringiensis]AJK33370.1 peptidase M23 family protein [Bacillus cereus]
MKKILASVAVASVTGSVFISTAQAKNTVIQKEAKHEKPTDVVKYENQVTVNTNALRVRTQPNTSSTIMGRVYEGEVLQVIGEENSWLKINHKGKTGYVSSEFVSENSVSAKTNVSMSRSKTVIANVLRVRTQPNTSSAIMGRVYEGKALQVIGEENGWLKIKHNGKVGYVSSQFVIDGTSNGSDKNNGKVQVASGNYKVNVSSLRVRTGPSTSHTILGSVHKGQIVQVTGEVQDWVKINYSGQTAYISKDYISKNDFNANVDQTNEQQKNITVQTDGTYIVDATSLRVRTGPATYHSVIGGVLNGRILQVTGVENGWLKIKHNGRTGYVSSEYVKFVKGNTPSKPETSNPSTGATVGDYYVNVNVLNVRSGAGTNHGVIGALSKGIKVQVLFEQNGWGKINYNGKNAYVSSKFLSKTSETDAEKQRQSQEVNKTNDFIQPAAGRYTSRFEKRGGKMHHGLDIAASGTVPVVAAAEGVITRSYYSTSYGNVVFISHNINGQTYTTVYAHLKSRSVSAGQKVKQGQQLGIMGNTGQSEGQHLHFEIHKGEWNAQKSNAMDPKIYIG